MSQYRYIHSVWPAATGDGSTLSFDFTTGVLDSRLTFTRSTTGTYINSSGYVTSASINTARFDYDPTTLTPRGLLIEGAAVNLLKYSAYADTNWIAFGGYTKSYITTISSPANDTSAARVTFSAVGHGLYTNNSQMGYTNTVGATYTMSAWIRATSNTTNLNIRFGDSAVGSSPNIPITTTWTRYSYSYVAVSASGPQIQSASGTATGEFEMWGFQLEAGSGASSYIPTGASQGSRAADFCYMSGISSWFNAPTGTIISKVTYSALTGSNSGIELSVGIGSSSTNRIAIRKDYVDYYSGGGAAQAEMYPTVTSGAVQIGTAYAANDFAMCSNGGTMRTDSSGAVPIGLDTLKLYSDAGSSSGLFLNGWMRSFKYFPTRLSNTQLQSLTT